MHSDRWEEVERLFADAAELPPAERASFLDSACGDDESLRAEVEALLAADEGADAFVDEMGERVVGPTLARALDERDPLLGSIIGPYRVEERVGVGGMGTVYRASRADGAFEQTVALKVVRVDLRPDLRERFLAERQILARLDHQAIARLHDGGLTPDGRPWLAMDYVHGLPVTEYADEHRLSISARLELFRRICRAVAYAHQNLVVHRDLKPSNILVTESGEVKLLDFGIARLIGEGQEGMTIAGSGPMTPEYAAPEQVRGTAITVATDVYALGILLYELLTGRRPYRMSSRVRHEVERVILEEEPTRPSTVVERDMPPEERHPATADTLSRARGVDPPALRRRLSGDLDVIVLKALRKEPDQRYATANDFEQDVERHLSGRPVRARPPTLLYRADRYVRRHRWSVAAVVTIAVLVMAYLVTVTYQSAAVAAERDRAELEARKSDEVASFLVSLFIASQPEVAQGTMPTARDLLERGAARAGELAAEPEVRAEVLAVIGRAYLQLGLHEQADSILASARRDLEALGPTGRTNPSYASVLNNQAALALARGQFSEADTLFGEALAVKDRLGRADLESARILANRATLASTEERHADAVAGYRTALAIFERELGQDHPDYLSAMVSLGVSLRRTGEVEAAEAQYRQAIDIHRRHAPRHPGLSTALNNLGMLLHSRGESAEARPLIREAFELRQLVLGDDHPETTELVLTQGIVALGMEDYPSARQLLQDAVHRFESQLGPNHPHVAIAAKSLGDAMRDDGDPASAIPVFERSVDIFEATFPRGHGRISGAYIGLGKALMQSGRLDSAVAALRTGLEGYRAALSQDALPVFGSKGWLGEALLLQGHLDEAQPLLEASLAGHQARSGNDHPETQHVARLLRRLYAERGDAARADELVARHQL